MALAGLAGRRRPGRGRRGGGLPVDGVLRLRCLPEDGHGDTDRPHGRQAAAADRRRAAGPMSPHRPGAAPASRGSRVAGPPGPPPEQTAQRLRVRFAKRGRLRFASHRDVARAMERALRKAELPVAYSGGFNPHPKLSFAGAAPTGVASEAEYLEVALTATCEPGEVRDRLGAALPPGLDVVDVTEVPGGTLGGDLQASEWHVTLLGVPADTVETACHKFLAADRVEVERLTPKGLRRLDARAAVVALEPDWRAVHSGTGGCAILRMVVRHM